MKNEQNPESFEMILENENSFTIKRVYPNSLTSEEKEKAEKDTPEVILHCFDVKIIKELQEVGEKLAQRQLANSNGNSNRKNIFLNFF